MTYYYRQIDKQTGAVNGYITYDDVRPTTNESELFLLEELTEAEYQAETAELIDLTAAGEDDLDEATAEDYENALRDIGVTL